MKRIDIVTEFHTSYVALIYLMGGTCFPHSLGFKGRK